MKKSFYRHIYIYIYIYVFSSLSLSIYCYEYIFMIFVEFCCFQTGPHGRPPLLGEIQIIIIIINVVQKYILYFRSIIRGSRIGSRIEISLLNVISHFADNIDGCFTTDDTTVAARTRTVQNLDSPDLDWCGNTVGTGADRSSAVSSMSVAIGLLCKAIRLCSGLFF